MHGYKVERSGALKVKDVFIFVNLNVYSQQYGVLLKGPLCILQREAWQLIPGVIIYVFHLSYKWHNMHAACLKCCPREVLSPPVVRYKRSRDSCQLELYSLTQ